MKTVVQRLRNRIAVFPMYGRTIRRRPLLHKTNAKPHRLWYGFLFQSHFNYMIFRNCCKVTYIAVCLEYQQRVEAICSPEQDFLEWLLSIDTRPPPECSCRMTKSLVQEHRVRQRVTNPNSDKRVFDHFCTTLFHNYVPVYVSSFVPKLCSGLGSSQNKNNYRFEIT